MGWPVVNLVAQLDKVADQVHAEGGWGYTSSQPYHLEPTCLALLALHLQRDRYQPIIARGLNALAQSARPDGTYRLPRGREAAVWPTSLVLFVKSSLGRPAAELRPSIAFLLGLKGRALETKEAQEVQDIDLKLTGWPWAEGNFSWAEPTAWACLALRKAGHGAQPRVAEGIELLLDRALDEGGINYGNRRILGRLTEPIPGPTAMMLLAVQGQSHPRIAAAVAYLLQHSLTQPEDVEHLCWARLALDLYTDQPGVREALPQLDDRIRTAHQNRAATSYLQPYPHREALVGLALGVAQGLGRNPFNLAVAECEADGPSVPPSTSTPKKPGLLDRVKSSFRGLVVNAVGQLRTLPPTSPVHIARADSYDADLAAILHKQFEHFRAAVPLAGKRVVLKPNLVEWHRDKVINTNPKVVAAVIELCRREGAAEVVVAEGPGHWRNVEYLVSASGLGDVLKQHSVPFVDLNHDEPVKVQNMGRCTGLEYLFLSRTIATADVVISLPKLKTHHWAGATLSLKNLFGTLPGICYGWPKNELHWRGIENSIVDIALTRTPELAIVDGIVGMEGDGPLNGTAKPMRVLVMGTDLLAVDATCCRLMMLDPEKIGYLQLGHFKKLGHLSEAAIQQVGEPIAGLAKPFATVPHFETIRIKIAG
jgi:uncharacterized protein (DUF362 family)